MASDYTDGLALQAIKLVFENLESSVKNADFHSREKDAQCVNDRRYGLRQCLPWYFSLNGPQDRCAIPHHPRTDQCHLTSIRYLATTVHAQLRQLHGLSTTTTVQMKNTKISLSYARPMLYPEEAVEATQKLYTNSVNAVVSK